MIYDYIVIGAGYGGLTTAALLAKRGLKVLLLEAHTAVGGCASYFKRKDFHFDVGATTLSGLLDHQPIGKLLKELEINLAYEKINPGIIINYKGKIIKRFADHNLWVRELADKLDCNIKPIIKLFEELNSIDSKAWQILDANPGLMPSSIVDYVKLVKNYKYCDIALSPFQSFASFLRKNKITNNDLIAILDQILLISTQNTAEKTPLMSAALGLMYPSEVYYSFGGITQLAEKIKAKFLFYGGEILFKKRVVKLNKEKSHYDLITATAEIYQANNIVSNIPIWNMKEISTAGIHEYYKSLSTKFQDAWGAFTTYFSLNSNAELDSLYYQIHTDSIPHCNSSSIFVSFSHINDRKRAPEGYRTVTISTHTKAEQWLNLCNSDYETKKRETEKAIITSFLKAFPQYKIEQIDYLLSGSPKSFEYFTGRYNGLVGGIPHSVDKPIMMLPNQITPFDGLYMVGDTSFPGQGIATVIYSAQSLLRKLS